MGDTNLALAVEAANEASAYDTNIKFLLADKQILARILKYAVQEFKDMAVEDIMSSIGDDIDVGKKAAGRRVDKPRASERVRHGGQCPRRREGFL